MRARHRHRQRSRDLARAVILEAKARAGFRCSSCGLVFPPDKLTWHHRDPGQKRFGISTFVRLAIRNLELLREEIARCDLQCGSCHSRLHAEWRRLGRVHSTDVRPVQGSAPRAEVAS